MKKPMTRSYSSHWYGVTGRAVEPGPVEPGPVEPGSLSPPGDPCSGKVLLKMSPLPFIFHFRCDRELPVQNVNFRSKSLVSASL